MSFAQRHVIAVTTSAGGAAEVYSPVVTGKIQTLIYTKTDFANGVDFTITAEATGETIWTESDVNASKTVAPRQATHSNVGVASLYAGSGEPVEDHIALAEDRVKFVIASGGDTKSGTFTLIMA
jgi:hypothetical protein